MCMLHIFIINQVQWELEGSCLDMNRSILLQENIHRERERERERERSENYVAPKFVNSRQKFEPKI
jgi:hypothetical protein